ncbi:MAG TPA: acyltransferase [Candidatus Glassbacteria bacterium]|nr:acyltransferase [Candidatus Glassbacteria bacterium]
MAWLRERHLNVFRKTGMEIGKNCCIDSHAFLDQHGKIVIGDNVTITAWAKILTHDSSKKIIGKEEKMFSIIKDNAFIGIDSIILEGLVIGKDAIVGAGAVVTKDVPDGEIWAGIPAKKIGEVKKHE